MLVEMENRSIGGEKHTGNDLHPFGSNYKLDSFVDIIVTATGTIVNKFCATCVPIKIILGAI